MARSDRDQPDPGERRPIPPRPTRETETEMEQTGGPAPALGEAGRSVVQVNVEEDMPTNGGSHPVDEAATDQYGQYRPRTIAMIIVAIVVALLLALPIIWGLVELIVLAGIVGPLILAWAVLLVLLIVGAVVIGFRVAQSGL